MPDNTQVFAAHRGQSDTGKRWWTFIALVVWLGESTVFALPATGPGAPRKPETPETPQRLVEAVEIPWGHVLQPIDPLTETAELSLLPDLRTLPPGDLEIRLLSGGRRHLRLANTVWNSGQGQLELLGEFNGATRQLQVHQRIYTADDTFYDKFVGEFVWHPGHNHWHFGNFTLYQLWSLTPAGELGQLVASSDKLSYCLIDTNVVAPDHYSFAKRRHYYGCGRKRQGLSVGWGDKYDSFLDGQSLDLTGLADGLYGLRSTVNPEAKLLESDYDNNTALVHLRILGQRVHVIASPEFNETLCRADGHC